MISLSQAFAQWQEFAANIPKHDDAMLAESWNDYTDSLCKDGELGTLQYHHCPAYDEDMPGEGSRFDPLADDREFILDAMGVTLSAVFVPFSQSRNSAEKSPSLNWRVTLKKGGRDVLTTDYMQGCAYCPAYKNPVMFPGGKKRDQWSTDKAIAAECETGKRVKGIGPSGHVFGPGKAIDPPDVVEVLHSLLLDASALDSRDFADWCADFGYSDDSITARGLYDACIATATKLRAAFGDKTLRELNELFEGM